MFLTLFHRDPKPFDEGYLPVKDGHEIYYRRFGNPAGEPVLSFHGGPGSVSKAKHAACFDLKKYQVILFDQRGCGKSFYKNRFDKNTTNDLLDDAARLLDTVGIKKKVISYGGSWGATLALLFAQKYPERVKRIIVSCIWLARSEDRQWMSKTSGLFYPDFLDQIYAGSNGKDPTKYYTKLLFGSSKDMQKAMSLYGGYERLLGQVDPYFFKPPFETQNILSAQMFFHYESHEYFIKENQIIKEAKKIAAIPTLIVHNRLDMTCPVKQAWDLHKALPKSKIIIVPDRGHGSKLMFDVLKKEIKKLS